MLTDTSKPRPSGVVCKNCSPGSHPLTCCVTEDTVLSNQHSLRIQPSDFGFSVPLPLPSARQRSKKKSKSRRPFSESPVFPEQLVLLALAFRCLQCITRTQFHNPSRHILLLRAEQQRSGLGSGQPHRLGTPHFSLSSAAWLLTVSFLLDQRPPDR